MLAASFTSKAFGFSVTAQPIFSSQLKKVVFFHKDSVDKAGRTEAELELLMD